MIFVILPNMKTIIKNIAEIIQIEKEPKEWVKGNDMSYINTLKNAYIKIENEIISDFGYMNDLPETEKLDNIIDAENGMVFPTYCDSHTHLVFATSREEEFIDRINGLSYEEIHKNGGGILNSAKKLQNTTEEKLFDDALIRINEAIQQGTGAIEIKSGYGLTLESELKILRVIKKLKEYCDITIKSTFLGAHAIPIEFKNRKDDYLDLIIDKMLPIIAEEKLADFIDIFCEKNYFTVEDTKRLLKSANKFNLQAKTHVNQFNVLGGVKASIEMGAKSVDHLEKMKEEDYNSLKNSKCIATVLPSCSFFLGINYAPAKEMIKQGIAVALASDYNPGSSPSLNMNFVASLGCIKLNMSPEEVINATTINGAYAMGVEKELGSICVGKKANFFITKPITSYPYLHYSFGENIIKKVFINGKIKALK